MKKRLKKNFDGNSWRTVIDQSCQSFFDGCNTCRRMEGSDEAACTRMFCAEYQAPRCLDETQAQTGSSGESFGGRKVSYECETGESFAVTYDQFVGESGVVRLEPNQVRFENSEQEKSAVMSRTVAASGEKYESESGLVFWSRGLSAIVMQDDTNLYENCEEI